MILLHDKISKFVNDGEHGLGVFLDTSKAFDTVDHDILLHKFYAYGIRGVPREWLKSYLSCRIRYVVFDGVESRKIILTCGVPYGSILGLLLLSALYQWYGWYIKYFPPMLFVGDVDAFRSCHNANQLIGTTNGESFNIVNWCESDKL